MISILACTDWSFLAVPLGALAGGIPIALIIKWM